MKTLVTLSFLQQEIAAYANYRQTQRQEGNCQEISSDQVDIDYAWKTDDWDGGWAVWAIPCAYPEVLDYIIYLQTRYLLEF